MGILGIKNMRLGTVNFLQLKNKLYFIISPSLSSKRLLPCKMQTFIRADYYVLRFVPTRGKKLLVLFALVLF